MTTIAWDETHIAVDRRAISNAMRETRKAVAQGRHLLLGSGSTSYIRELCEWYRNGGAPAAWPAYQRTDEFCLLVVVDRDDGTIGVYEQSPYPLDDMPDRWAIGSGSRYALGALAAGASAQRAVEIAATLDEATGHGVDVYPRRLPA